MSKTYYVTLKTEIVETFVLDADSKEQAENKARGLFVQGWDDLAPTNDTVETLSVLNAGG